MVVVRALPPTRGPLTDGVADDDLVVVVPDGAVLVADTVPTDPDDDPVDAVFGDIEIDGRRVLRPAWSPTRALTDPTSVLPLAVRAGLVRAGTVDPWDPGLALTAAEAGLDVAHLPVVLTAHGAPPPAPGPDRLDAHLRARGIPARVVAGDRPGTWLLRPESDFRPRITVVIPTAGAPHPDGGGAAVRRCLDSLGRVARAGHADLDVILVIGAELRGDPDALVAGATVPTTLVRRPPGPFDFADAVNRGILAATGDLVLLLNDDTEVAEPDVDGGDALTRMAVHLEDPTVGAVGAALRYPDGTVQHAGVVLDDAWPLHPFVGADPAGLGEHGADVARDVVAVTGACLMARRADLLAVGALSTDFPLSFNDVDLCVRLRRRGLRVVIEPGAVIVHHETLTRTPEISAEEWDRWIGRWGEIEDPWYHPDHHRPDDPEDLRRNADHLPPRPDDRPPPARLRTTRLRCRVHRARPTRALE